MARPHLPALGVEEPAGERARRPRRAPQAAALPVGGEPILHRLPERLVHDRGMLAGMDLVAMPDAADEERVGEHGVELAAREGGAAAAAAVPMQPLRRADAGSIELGLQPLHRAEREIALEDPLHQRRLLRHRLQAARLGAVADRDHAAHPHALRLGGGDLVADPLGGDLALELAKESSTFSVSLPIEVGVLKAWVTETKETPAASKIATMRAKSASARVSRSTL